MTNITSEQQVSIAELFARFESRNRLPALVYGVVQGGELLFGGLLGAEAGNSQQPVEWQSLKFRIASMTKSFAAAAVLLLRDEGKLSLHQPVRELLPASAISADLGGLTVRQLLSMTADLPTDDPWGDRMLGSTDAEYGELFKTEYQRAGLGPTVCSYSNLGYMLLGRIVSVVAGVHAHDFITSRLLRPLGMDDTHWNIDRNDPAVRFGHAGSAGSWSELEVDLCRGDGDLFAGIWTTAKDLAIWIDFFSSAWSPRLIEKYDQLLCKNGRLELQLSHSEMPNSFITAWESSEILLQRSRYCLGLREFKIRDERYLGHSGGLPGYGSHMRWHTDSGLGIITLGNATYAPVTTPAAVALEYLCRQWRATETQASRSQSKSKRELAVRDRGAELLGLITSWDEKVADQLFAHNFFQDNDREQFNEECSRVSSLASFKAAHFKFQSEGGLAGAFSHLESWQMGLTIRFQLAPDSSAKIQKVDFIYLRGELAAELAAAAAELITLFTAPQNSLAIPERWQRLIQDLGQPVQLVGVDSPANSAQLDLRFKGSESSCRVLIYQEATDGQSKDISESSVIYEVQ